MLVSSGPRVGASYRPDCDATRSARRAHGFGSVLRLPEQLRARVAVRQDLEALRLSTLEPPDVDDREAGVLAVLAHVGVAESENGVVLAFVDLVDRQLELVPGADRSLERLPRLVLALVDAAAGKVR